MDLSPFKQETVGNSRQFARSRSTETIPMRRRGGQKGDETARPLVESARPLLNSTQSLVESTRTIESA